MNIIQDKIQSSIIELNSKQQKEELLSWLQEFHANIIKPLCKDLPKDIPDNQILLYKPFSINSNPAPGSLLIEHYDNPGWAMHFEALGTPYQNNITSKINYGENEYKNYDLNWFFIDGKYNAISGPLHLSTALYFFKKFIERDPHTTNKGEIISKSLIENIRTNNPILNWLENFYLDNNYEDKHPIYGYKIISTKSGWIFHYYSDEEELNNKLFKEVNISDKKGTIKLYKTCQYKFIIRAHSHGLITGLEMFKKWVES